MRLSKLTIENFRGIQFLELELDRDVTVLIGENNSGKTSVMEALRFGLDVVKSDRICNFTEYDFYRDKECKSLASTQPIILTFSFLETEEHLWPENITQALNDVIVGDDYSAIKLRLTAKFDTENGELTQRWCFLDDADNELVGKKSFLKDLRRLRPFFFQTALRAAKEEFHGKSTYWSSFLRNKDIDDVTRAALEEELFTVNQKIVDAHSSFKDVTDEVKRIAELVAAVKSDSVSVDPAPADIYKSLRYTEVNLLTGSDAKIPIRSHGEGTQSLSVLLLFSAYLKSRLKADVDKFAEPIIAIEEPEAHLHPNAIRAIWHILNDLPGQKIIATHSGDILSEVPIEKLRSMNRSTASSECKSIPAGLLADEELRKFNHHVRRNRGELLFAKTWLLVEGETDVSVFAECADQLDIKLHRHGIRIVEYSQAGGPGIFIKVADALGIHWHLVTDADDGGKRYEKSAKAMLNERSESDYISRLTESNMDLLLCNAGYGEPYADGIATQKPPNPVGTWDEVLDEMKQTFIDKPGQALNVARKLRDRSKPEISEEEGTSEYWEQVYKNLKNGFSKPAAALDSILLMKGQGKEGVPSEISKILDKLIIPVGGEQ